MCDSFDGLEEYLLEDGAPRDLEFEDVTWAGVWHLIAELGREFPEVSVGSTSLDTEAFQTTNPRAAIEGVEEGRGTSAQLLFGGGGESVTRLQLIVSTDGVSAPAVELSFFPQHLLARRDLVSSFQTWVRRLRSSLGASRVYARENPSLKL